MLFIDTVCAFRIFKRLLKVNHDYFCKKNLMDSCHAWVDSICTKKHKMHKMHKHPWFWKFYLHKEVSTTKHSKILFAQRENYFCIGWKFYLHKEKSKNSICTKRLLVTIWASKLDSIRTNSLSFCKSSLQIISFLCKTVHAWTWQYIDIHISWSVTIWEFYLHKETFEAEITLLNQSLLMFFFLSKSYLR